MTMFTINSGPFNIKSTPGAVIPYFEVSRLYNGLTFSNGAMVVSTDFIGYPDGVRFRNGHMDSPVNRRLVISEAGVLRLSEPMGTVATAKALKGRAPDGTIWYMQVTNVAPA